LRQPSIQIAQRLFDLRHGMIKFGQPPSGRPCSQQVRLQRCGIG
jgi:hypothetical protein